MLLRFVFLTISSLLLIYSPHYADVKLNSNMNGGRVFSPSDEVVPGIVIIKFKTDIVVESNSMTTNSEELNNFLNQTGIMGLEKTFKNIYPLEKNKILEGEVDLSRLYYGYIDINHDPREVASRLSNSGDIEYAEPKFIHFIEDVPNDPMISTQNNAFTRMNVFNGWTIAKGDTNVAIATIDGGTFWQHEDLYANLWINRLEDINNNGRFDLGPPPLGDEDGIDQDGNGFIDDVIGWNFANNTNNPKGLLSTPSNAEHGTATASNFGAVTNNGIGMAGTSWNCRLMPVCASAATDNGIAFGYEGIVYAFSNGAKVINCSWGRRGGYSLFEQDIINAALQAGALIVASAGNSGLNNDLSPHYPSSYKNVLAVGATNSTNDVKTSWSNYGRTIPVFAPGVSILGATNAGGYSTGNSGTSFSSPLVAGLAGILKSANPSWTPRQIAAQIKVTCDSIDVANPSFAGNMGRGRVNFARALTESHPGIEILNASILTTKGKDIFLQGDTVLVTLTVKNILFVDANNLTFTATTSDAALQVLQGTASTSLLSAGQQVTLSPLMLRVGTLTAAKDIVIRLNWLSNTNDRDSYGYKVTVFPSTPLWATQTSPTQISLYSVKAINQNVVWAAGANGVVLRTTNGGTDWSAVATTSILNNHNIEAIDANTAFVLSNSETATADARIYKTTNSGLSWTMVYQSTASGAFLNALCMFDTNNGIVQGDPVGGKWIILRTTDGGNNWSRIATEPTQAGSEAGWNNSMSVVGTTHIWFGTNNSRVYRSTDGGNSWSSSASGATNSYGVAFKDSMNGIVVHSTGAIRVSVNGGSSWTSVTSPTTAVLTGVSYLRESNFAWIASSTTPFKSTSNGSSWVSQATYPISGTINHISFVDTSNGWAVTSNGEVLRYILPTPTGVDPNNIYAFPTNYILGQNYPNPFNPATIIKYQLPEDAYVKLIIYDVLGREVTTLVNEVKKVGSYEVEFDGGSAKGGLPSGIYFYQLKVYPVGDGAGSPRGQAFVQTKKAILMK